MSRGCSYINEGGPAPYKNEEENEKMVIVDLPIDQYRNQIVDLIRTNDITIISSGTGTGKSTRVPQFILFDHDYSTMSPQTDGEDGSQHRSPTLSIAVTQPRRIATTRTAIRVAQELGVEVGDGLVGYQMSLDHNTTKETAITFMTTGTLVEILSICKGRVRFSHIILDEIHGRDIYNDELLLQIKLIRRRDPSWKVKVILLSATMNMNKFVDYFSQNNKNTRIAVLDIPSSEKAFPITTYFIDDLANGTLEGIKLDGLESVNPGIDFNHNPNYAKMPCLINQLNQLENWEKQQEQVKVDVKFHNISSVKRHSRIVQEQANATNVISRKGAVLIFLPGIGEIKLLRQQLQSYSLSHNEQWKIVDMHSNMSDEEQNAVFPSVLAHQRKIILATNVAENSVTIQDVKYVIDFCMTKYMKFDTLSAFSGIMTSMASHHQCIQRAGRAGRIGPGYCFRLVTRYIYDKEMTLESTAEMQNCGLGLAFIHLKKLGMGPPLLLFKEAIHPPEIALIKYSVLLLKEAGALTIYMKNGSYDPMNGELTTIGRLASSLCCDPRQARLIAFGQIFGLLDDAIVIAMSLSSKPIFATFHPCNFEKGVEAFLAKIHVGGGLNCDAIANLGAYNIYLENLKKIEEFEIYHNNKDTEENNNWTRREAKRILKSHYIKGTVMQNLDYTIKRMYKKLSVNFHIVTNGGNLTTVEDLQKSPYKLLRMKLLIAAAAYPNIFHRSSHIHHDQYLAAVHQELQGYDPKTSLILQVPDRNINKYDDDSYSNDDYSDGNSLSENEYDHQHQYDAGTEDMMKTPNLAQLNEVQEQLTFDNSNSPSVIWNKWKRSLIVSFHPDSNNQNDWVGPIAKDVYRGLKYKGMSHQFYWTTDHNGSNIQDEDGTVIATTYLTGPNSPIANKFICNFNSKILYKKPVYIDRDSVNQYTLDLEFPTPFSYTMASMQLTHRKSLIAKDATIMPSIHGMHTFLHLLFAPNLNLVFQHQQHEDQVGYDQKRPERKGGRRITTCRKQVEYIAATAGLGFISTPHFQMPIFKSHNSNVEFDVKIAKCDLEDVNWIRTELNHALEMQTFCEMNKSALSQRQALMNRIITFMTKPRHQQQHPPASQFVGNRGQEDRTKTGVDKIRNIFELFPPHKYD